MELKLAKETLKSDGHAMTITFDEMEKIVDESGRKGTVFYLERENSEKDLKKLVAFFKGKNRHTLIRELMYSMDSKDYIYEVHVL